MLPNISPIINKAMVSFTLEATANTAAKTKKLPTLENRTRETSVIRYPKAQAGKKVVPMIRSATARLAPELMPKTKGPAKGFLNSVCINNPHTDNPLPTKIAVMALGMR
jgi:hypothetical protein